MNCTYKRADKGVVSITFIISLICSFIIICSACSVSDSAKCIIESANEINNITEGVKGDVGEGGE